MIQLQTHRISSGFESVGLRPTTIPLGHVLNIDHFHMSQPTFPPHPHAGFSAVTLMLPWSSGSFVNRDSKGDRSRIAPGDLHWTLAGSGMLHEEIPEEPGVDCEGLQIFVKLPETHELCEPAAFHLKRDDMPTLERPGARVRVHVGTLDGVVSPMPSHADTMLAHATVSDAWSLFIPSGVEAFVLVLRGTGLVGNEGLAVHQVCSLEAGQVNFQGNDLELLVGWSLRMETQPTFRGPFCMFKKERLDESVRRFRSGAMGDLTPSPVQWQRF